MVWFQQPWFDSAEFANPWWHAFVDDPGEGGSYITFGYGQSASKAAMLGLVPSATAQGGSYITFGYGQSASKAAMLGLAPSAATQSGSYITLGTVQSASLFVRFGMGIGAPIEPPEPPIITPMPGGGYHFYYPPSNRARILRDDQDIIALLISALHSGLLD